MSTLRNYSALDRLIMGIDQALKLSSGRSPKPARPNPARDLSSGDLDADQKQHVAGLMRINHAGEICAQALYAGQAATARNPEIREEMEQAANEEIDHLSWCSDRLEELGSRPSALNPLWYAGSFALGALAGIAGDAWSLGFLKETENQVESHLADHLDKLPPGDERSQAILEQMKTDEARHAAMADAAGARPLPEPVRDAMAFTAGIMKALAYRI